MRWAEEISREEWERIDQVIGKYQGRHGALIPVLKEVQDICGYLPKKVQHRIAQGLHLPSSQVYGVVSFYAFFTTIPRGKYIIRVCLGNGLLCERAPNRSWTIFRGNSRWKWEGSHGTGNFLWRLCGALGPVV